MKHIIILFAAVAMSLSLNAQHRHHDRQRKELAPEEVATKQAMNLREKITSITDQQYEQIYAIYLWRAQESKAERDSVMSAPKDGERPKMDREKMQQRENVVNDALKLILDETQYAAYEKMREEQRQRMRRNQQRGMREIQQRNFDEREGAPDGFEN